MADDIDFAQARDRMLAAIDAQVIFHCPRLGKAALDRRVLQAMADLPREAFVAPDVRPHAYADSPLPIGCGKTLSQPFIVAVMTDLLAPRSGERVLEIGTGHGYQTALLARLSGQVFTIELIRALSDHAASLLRRLGGLDNVVFKVGNGHLGWPEMAPFHKILLSAAPASVPPALLRQLAPGGRMVLPAGPPEQQKLLVIERGDGPDPDEFRTREVFAVRFSELEDSTPR
jgi:protein-L-isoaspartate(D-aspartate) O-methyltransferase